MSSEVSCFELKSGLLHVRVFGIAFTFGFFAKTLEIDVDDDDDDDDDNDNDDDFHHTSGDNNHSFLMKRSKDDDDGHLPKEDNLDTSTEEETDGDIQLTFQRSPLKASTTYHEEMENGIIIVIEEA